MKNISSNNKIVGILLILLMSLCNLMNSNAQSDCINYVYPDPITPMNFTAQGGNTETKIIGVGLNYGGSCSYNVTNNSPWINVIKNSEYQYTIWCSPNTSSGARTGTVRFTYPEKEYTIQQACILPSQPGSITGPTSVLSGQTGLIYNVPAITNATEYVWSVPSGATIVSTGNSTSITVNYSCTASTGVVKVYGKNSCGNGPMTSLSVNVPALGTITGPATACAQSSQTYSVSSVTGASSYQWTLPPGATGSSTSNSINITMGSQTGYVIVAAINQYCTIPSVNKLINVTTAVAYNVGGGGTICNGQTTSITLSSSFAALKYKAYCNGSAIESSIKDGTGNSLTFNNLGAAGTYTVKAIDPVLGCALPMNGTATITVNPNPTITLGANPTIAYGSTSATLNFSNPTENPNKYSIVYNQEAITAGFSNVSNINLSGNSIPLSIPVNAPAKTYSGSISVSNTNGCSSNTVFSIVIYSNLTPGTIGSSQNNCYNATPNPLTQLTVPTGGVGQYALQWQKSDVSGWVDISGDTTSTYSPGILAWDTKYRLKVSNGVYGTVFTEPVTITIKGRASGAIEGVDQTIDYGTSAIPLMVTVGASGEPYTRQWQSSSDNASWSNISGATNATYAPGSPTSSKYYRVQIIASSCSPQYTSSKYIKVIPLAVIKFNYNYIKETSVMDSSKRDTSQISGLNVGQINKTISYFDGLGRPMQQINWQATPGKMDIIQPVAYDDFGREKFKYLPFADNTNDGAYRRNAINDQNKFYLSGDPSHPATIPADANPFSETIFDNSPLNMVTKQGTVGTAWQPSTGRSSQMSYLSNTSQDVLQLEVDLSSKQVVNTKGDLFNSKRYYPANTLIKTIVKDENWRAIDGTLHTTVEFKNQQGQVLLKRSYVKDELSNILPVETYYVYDDFGSLRFVIPPLAMGQLGFPADKNNTIVKNLCYYYEYDSCKRMAIKQLPGASEVYMVYDDRDRIVATQDGNLRDPDKNPVTQDGKWMFTKYDVLNRPVMTGTYSPSEITRTALQAAVNLYYKTAGKLRYTARCNQTTNATGYLISQSYPEGVTESNLLSLTYYDNYTEIPGAKAFSAVPELKVLSYNPKVTGQVTASRIKVFDGTSTWLTSSNYYDNKNRPIQTIKSNYVNGNDTLTSKYDFVGRIEKTRLGHTGLANKTIIKEFVYDHMGRLTKIYHKIDQGNKILMSYMKYNELGQLIDKKLHVTDLVNYNTFVQSIDYRYNIRGWLQSINNPALNSDSGVTNDDSTDKFGMKLQYNQQ